MTHFDYIIIGAGAAGLMLADAMTSDDYFKDRSILLIDKDSKQTNDRTWCFWEQGEGQFDALVKKNWGHIYFGGKTFSKRFDIHPYRYKMIRGIDFYRSVLERITVHHGVIFKQAEVIDVQDDGAQVTVVTPDQKFTSGQVFTSIFNYEMATHQNRYPVLQQHFLGWFVRTEKEVFDTDQATYMDFSVPQKGNTRFMYVLPTSPKEALVEYTLFSEHLLPKKDYENAITAYMENHFGSTEYEITEVEKGSIPMTCYDFQEHHSKNVRFIGTAGGWAKPSTGYTFASTARKVPKLVEHIKTGRPLDTLRYKNRFWYYDLLLLDVLHKDNAMGQHIFETLFKNRDPQLIFKFLDEQTAFWEELYYISGCPKLPFTKALLKRLFQKGF